MKLLIQLFFAFLQVMGVNDNPRPIYDSLPSNGRQQLPIVPYDVASSNEGFEARTLVRKLKRQNVFYHSIPVSYTHLTLPTTPYV